jgi:hypothetical protein
MVRAVMVGPPHDREARALGRDAHQDQQQGQLCQPRCPQPTREPEAIGERLQHEQDRTNRATGRWEGAADAIDLAREGTAQGRNPFRRPGRQVRQRAGTHGATFAAGFTQETGGWSMAMGNRRDLPADNHASALAGFGIIVVYGHAYTLSQESR